MLNLKTRIKNILSKKNYVKLLIAVTIVIVIISSIIVGVLFAVGVFRQSSQLISPSVSISIPTTTIYVTITISVTNIEPSPSSPEPSPVLNLYMPINQTLYKFDAITGTPIESPYTANWSSNLYNSTCNIMTISPDNSYAVAILSHNDNYYLVTFDLLGSISGTPMSYSPPSTTPINIGNVTDMILISNTFDVYLLSVNSLWYYVMTPSQFSTNALVAAQSKASLTGYFQLLCANFASDHSSIYMLTQDSSNIAVVNLVQITNLTNVNPITTIINSITMAGTYLGTFVPAQTLNHSVLCSLVGNQNVTYLIICQLTSPFTITAIDTLSFGSLVNTLLCGLAWDNNGNVWYSDNNNFFRIQTQNDNQVTTFQVAPIPSVSLRNVTISADGTYLYVCNPNLSIIYQYATTDFSTPLNTFYPVSQTVPINLLLCQH